MSRVYSYLRFSSPKQASGTSAARQSEYARRWAEENGMVLDDTLSMRDEGLSAFHQKHIKQGALGAFLAAISEGHIPAGSVLIVEGLDRLSRAEPVLAQAQLAQIINAGINVITASDGRQYNRESLKANPMDLVYSLLVMIRAHEESETKSKRVKQAILRKCREWVAGKRVDVPSGKHPSWVRQTENGMELIPERAEAMRLAISLYLDGYGPHKILRELASRGMDIVGSSSAGNIDALLTKHPELLRGNRTMTVLGENFLLEGYYPPLLSPEEYARLMVAIAARRQRPKSTGGKSRFPPLFTGMGKGSCGVCGAWVVSQNAVRKNQDGSNSVYRRIRCPACELKSSSEGNTAHMASCFAKPIEAAILDYCSDQFNLSSLTEGGGRNASLIAERAVLLEQIADHESKLQKMADAMLEGDLPQTLIRRMHDQETSLAKLKAREQQIDAETVVVEQSTPESAQAWAKLKDGVLALDYDARRKARRLVDDTFAEIKVYFRGALPTTPDGCVDIMLVAKNGVRRLLTISRETGRVVRGLERPTQTSGEGSPNSAG